MPLEWRTAYLRQARSDYQMLKLLSNTDGVALCQKLHYLQMATEKLSKALKVTAQDPRPAKTHDALVKFLKIAKGRPDVQRICRIKDKAQLQAYIDGLKTTAKDVEDLSPEGPDHPNPECPWEADHLVRSPLDHPFTNVDLKSPKIIKLLEFVDDCFHLPEPR